MLEPLILYRVFVVLYVDMYVVRGLYRLAQSYKGLEKTTNRSQARKSVRSVRRTVRLFVFTPFCSSKQMFILIRRTRQVSQ